MIHGMALLTCLFALQDPASEALDLSITLPAESLEVGKEYEIVIEVTPREGWSASDAGIPQPILQIDVPGSVKLAGPRLKTHKELSNNEFLQAPFEILIKQSPTRVRFELKRDPQPEDAFGFNVLAYVSKGGDDARFVRRRYELPLQAGASATAGAADKSDWGDGKGKELRIGDKAANFVLPRADGSKVALKKLLGEKTVIVTTYRAFW